MGNKKWLSGIMYEKATDIPKCYLNHVMFVYTYGLYFTFCLTLNSFPMAKSFLLQYFLHNEFN